MSPRSHCVVFKPADVTPSSSAHKRWNCDGGVCTSHASSMDALRVDSQAKKTTTFSADTPEGYPSLSRGADERVSCRCDAKGSEKGVSSSSSCGCGSGGCTNEEKARREEQKQYFRNYYKFQSERDFAAFWRSFEVLGHSCWFHTDMDRDEAKALLEQAPEGTFLLRPSASPSHVFSLTLRLPSGPVSCRINYRRGLFKLDSTGDDVTNPWFEDVVQLVDWYVRCTRRDPENGGLSFVMRKGDKRTQGTAKMIAPSRTAVPSLAHWARLSVNRSLPEIHIPSISVDRLPVPKKVKDYLQEYPYIV